MTGEYRNPYEIYISRTAASLDNGDSVNDINYNRLTANLNSADGGDIIDIDGIEEEDRVSSVMLLHYPASTLSQDPFSAAIQLRRGVQLPQDFIHDAVHRSYDESMMEMFIPSMGTAKVVEFAREAHQEGVALLEKRNRVLRDNRAPLAAIAINVSGSVCTIEISTPEFVWPWVALRELQQAMEQDL